MFGWATLVLGNPFINQTFWIENHNFKLSNYQFLPISEKYKNKKWFGKHQFSDAWKEWTFAVVHVLLDLFSLVYFSCNFSSKCLFLNFSKKCRINWWKSSSLVYGKFYSMWSRYSSEYDQKEAWYRRFPCYGYCLLHVSRHIIWYITSYITSTIFVTMSRDSPCHDDTI